MNIYQLFSDKKNSKDSPPLVFKELNKKRFKELNEKGYGIYFAVNDFNDSRKETDLKALRYAYTDIDVAKNGDGQTREEIEVKKGAKILDLIGYCPPTKIIDTANGIQPLWELNGDRKPTPENIKRYKNIIMGIIEATGGDKGAKDVSRVLRMPDYYHMKAEPYLCELVHNHPEISYTLDELEELFPYEAPKIIIDPVRKYNDDNQIDSLNFKEVVRRCYREKGVSISFGINNNLCLSGAENDPTSAFIDHNNNCYLHHGDSTRLLDIGLAYEGNAFTLPANMLFGGHIGKAKDWLKKEFNLLDEDIKRQLDRIKKNEDSEEDLNDGKRFTWGTNELNNSVGLIKPTNFIVVGASTNSGKTTYCFDMAIKNALMGNKSMFISLEMDTDAILDDFSRKYSGITVSEQYNKNVPQVKLNAYKKRKKELKETPNLFLKGIRGEENITWKLIEAIIDEDNVDIVFVDNLDLIKSDNQRDDNLERQKSIVASILSFTKRKRIPVVLIHHYRKTSSGKSYGLNELSGSGKIADGADIIVKIARNTAENAIYPDKYKSFIHLQKCRGYQQCYREIYFIKGKFVDDPDGDGIDIDKIDFNL